MYYFLTKNEWLLLQNFLTYSKKLKKPTVSAEVGLSKTQLSLPGAEVPKQ